MRQRRRLTRAALVAFVVSLIIFLPTAASASPDDFSFESMSVSYTLGRDAGGNATLLTEETLVAVFPNVNQNHGIIRAIPLRYGEARLELSDISVTDGDGKPLSFSRSDQDNFAQLRIGDADSFVQGTHTYRITYRERNVVKYFADTKAAEFYWDVNGTGWAQGFGSVTATLHLADGIGDALTGNMACYRGYEGSTDSCTIVRSGDTITASTTDLTPYQNMTMAIGFVPGTFADPPLLKNLWFFSFLPWVLIGLSIAATLVIVFVRIFVWRDAKGRGIIVAQYTPPKDAYPMLAAEFLKRSKSALPAQLVRFAVARVLDIRERPLVPKEKRYEVELLAGWPTAPDNERWVLNAVFGTVEVGATQVLDEKDKTLGDRLSKHQNKMFKEVQTRRWRAQPVSRIPSILRWSTFLLFVVATVIRFVSIGYEIDSFVIGFAMFLCLVGWILVGALSTRPYLITEKGAEVRDYLYGIRDYISLAEEDRIAMLQAPGTAERIDVTDDSAVVKLYEKLLPYAIIFGIENEWIAALGRHYEITEAPEWYQGGSNFASMGAFSASVAQSRFATTAPVSSGGSSWSSSGGSSSFSGGSSGGGSSGGGGGGGGGGGW